ncbi:DnaB-like helicase N-terminal domain-containing protein [Occultella kanbiaonis]|uniref:DnaB-like helicase N-terminal domain-containing protein n=1 Tax=Occultella kanbiaonis TaxID=2675754 RepID=UPI0013D3F1E5|nr:DnaB-like helicase N-terminal domain-containing protein [Occultella kanbiaonis]
MTAASIDAEKAVLGSLLLDPGKVREAVQNVAPSDFASPALGRLYSLITGRASIGEPIDPLTLWPAVRADAILARTIKSAVDLHSLMEATPTAENVGYYARQVADSGQSRRLLSASERLAMIAQSDEMTAAEKLTEARGQIEAIASDYAQAADVPTLAEVLAVEDSYDWVIPGLLERMDRLVLTGGEGLGKSTWLRQIAVLAAAGIHPTRHGERIDPVRVTVIDTENTERQWRRKVRPLVHKAAMVGHQNPGEAIRLLCTGRMNITSERDLGTVHTILDTHPTDILLIGPLYKLSPKGLNHEDDAAQVIAALDNIRERGVCLLMEAHAGKALGGDGERNMSPRGSSALLGWPEFGLGLAWDTSMLLPGDRPSIVNVKRWRGDREDDRSIPYQMRRGGDWPWTDLNYHPRQGRWTPSDSLREEAS